MAQGEHLPSNFRSIVPVSLRSMRPKKVTLNNKVSCVFLSLPVGKMEPFERLQDVHAKMVSAPITTDSECT